MKSEYKLKRKQ